MKSPISFFKEILNIPRPSGREDKIADYLVSFAEENGLEWVRDKHNNVLIRKSGIGDTLILQGHSDMVCEKNEDVEHDFDTDPIKTAQEVSILRACGTTLGADDGISMAVMLSLLSDNTVNIPLECLITSGEEIGLLGMNAFDFSLLKGRKMINLDSMDEGVATVSCCGGVRSDVSLGGSRKKCDLGGYKLKIIGLYGGHSGEDIGKGRKNAILCALSILRHVDGLRISEIQGGAKDNAIPRECTVIFTADDPMIGEKTELETETIRRSLCDEDLDFNVSLEEVRINEIFDADMTERLFDAVSHISLGVIEMDPHILGLVKTSANLGIIGSTESGVHLTVSSRSSDESVLDSLEGEISTAAEKAHGKTVHRGRYPGWDFAVISPLRDLYMECYERLFEKKAAYEGIHAGLECGIVKSHIPEMDVISIGADISSPHTPSESLDVDSLDRLHLTVREMIRCIEAE